MVKNKKVSCILLILPLIPLSLISFSLLIHLPAITTVVQPARLLIIPNLKRGTSLCALPNSSSTAVVSPGGKWTLLQNSIGISAMHMQLLHDNTIIIFDRTSFGPSNLSLSSISSSPTPAPTSSVKFTDRIDNTAHSIIYDVESNTFRPLSLQTDTWCSSGSVNSNGTLVQTGGYGLGERVVRIFTPCNTTSKNGTTSQVQATPPCDDWRELPTPLSVRRWYSSSQLLPDGRIIIVGGRMSFSFEFFPPSSPPKAYRLHFLHETWEGRDNENNLYPFLHILPDGNLFIFAKNRSISFNYTTQQIVREFPPIPGIDRRCYPSTGSSILLPITLPKSKDPDLEVLICGGAPAGSALSAMQNRSFLEASKTCGRLRVTDPEPVWFMEDMPIARVMGDMVILPSGDVLIINGAGNGTAGWDNADNPIFTPVLYKPHEPDPSQRFVVMNRTTIPRMYHSSAVLVPDGRVLVSGSNPNPYYNFTGVRYKTELSMEAYSPEYLDPSYDRVRPSNLSVESESGGGVVMYGEVFTVRFNLTVFRQKDDVRVVMIFPPFATHSFGMNQRMLVMKAVTAADSGGGGIERVGDGLYSVQVRAPVNVNVGLPGYYMLFVVHGRIPSKGVWIRLVRPLPMSSPMAAPAPAPRMWKTVSDPSNASSSYSFADENLVHRQPIPTVAAPKTRVTVSSDPSNVSYTFEDEYFLGSLPTDLVDLDLIVGN